MENVLYYSNERTIVKVTIFDDEVASHLSNYLIPEPNQFQRFDWHVIVNRQQYCRPLTGTYIVQEGEYNEQIHEYCSTSSIVLHNQRTNSIIIKEPDKSVYVYNSSLSYLFMDTYRIVRQILISDLLNRGGVILHSSAISMNKKGYIFLGEKGAGKSTALFQYLISCYNDIGFISNERNIILFQENKLLIYGWQSVALIGVGTIASTIGLESLYDIHKKTGGTAYLLTEHQLINNEFITKLINMKKELLFGIKEKIWLTPVEISKITNRLIVNYTYLDKIILPRLDLDAPQQINDIKETLEKHVISDLKFFGDWLHLRINIATNYKETMDALNNVRQVGICGMNLVNNLSLL